MHLARVIRLDESDDLVYETAAEAGEWAVAGSFAFSDASEADLAGKRGQEFASGWLGLSSFGRASVVAVTPVTEAERAAAVAALAEHFVTAWGAPSADAARPVAEDQIAEMAAVCGDFPANTLLLIERDLTEAGVTERIRSVAPRDAPLEAFAVHGGD